MPFDSNDSLPKGVKNLPKGQQTKWRKGFNSAYEGTCKDRGDKRDQCASKVAWSQIDDKYKGKSSALVSFSMAIRSATHDKQKDTLRWKAVASDTDEDFYHDNMSLELFNDFVNKIGIQELVPEEFRSSFWSGGEPYLSISHYPDLDGTAIAGVGEKTYVDGNQLKSTGQFSKTPIGLASYHAICKDLYTEPKPETPIRISIAFLDWGHVHKSNEYEFERECIDDICPECIMEQIRDEFPGKIFKKGQLIHLALTRIPANERTSLEVEKSMTTRKEDAISIIGEELADEIDEKAKLTQKSMAEDGTSDMLVIKTDEDETIEEPSVVEDKAKPKPKKEDDDKDEPEEDEEDEKKKAKSEVKSEGDPVSKLEVDERLDKLFEIVNGLIDKPKELEPEHELNTVFSDFRAVFDDIKSQPISSNEKLQQLQEYFNEFADEIIARMKESEPVSEQPQPETEGDDLVQALSLALESALRPLTEKIDLALAQQSVVKLTPAIPARRSIVPTLSMQKDIHKELQQKPKVQSETPKLRDMIRKSVGLQE